MERVNNGTQTPGGESSTATGVSAIGSDIISSLDNAFVAAIKVGDWATLSSGFASSTERYEIISKPTATSIQVELIAILAKFDITVVTKSNMFTDGVAGVGRTIISARSKNINQEEIIAVIENNGDSIDSDNHQQLSNAVVKRAGDTMIGDLEIAGGKKIKVDDIESASGSEITLSDDLELPLNAIAAGPAGAVSNLIKWKRFSGFITTSTIVITHGLSDFRKILGIQIALEDNSNRMILQGNDDSSGFTEFNAHSTATIINIPIGADYNTGGTKVFNVLVSYFD